MPKVVDHHKRRIELADAAARVVARKGLENTTVRDITTEAGFTPGIIAHYFRDKNEILEHTLERLDERTTHRLVSPFEGDAPLRDFFESGLPLDDSSEVDLRARIQFWARALSSPELTKQQAKSFKTWTGAIRRLLQIRQKRGEISSDLELEPISNLFFALSIGVGLIAIFLPKRSRRAFSRQVFQTAADALFPEQTRDKQKGLSEQ